MASTHHPSKSKQRPLSALIRQAWASLSEDNIERVVTARQLTDHVNQLSSSTTDNPIPIQTILTVLNRWTTKKKIAKIPHSVDGSLQWGFIQLDPKQPIQKNREHILNAWLAPVIKDWCNNDRQLTLYTIQESLINRVQSIHNP
jgi:hypothetical protein